MNHSEQYLIQTNQLICAYLSCDSNLTLQQQTLHQLRVSTRRLIALSPPESYQTKLYKKLMQSTNYLRDIDVFLTETLPSLPSKWQNLLQEVNLAMLALRENQDIQFKLLLETELYQEFADLQKDYADTVKKSTANSDRQKLVLDDVKKRLKKQIKLVQVMEIEDKHLHKARLKIKRLHYQIEHFYPHEKSLLASCQLLQHELGRFHDYFQAINLLKKHKNSLETSLYKELVTYLEQKKEQQIQHIRQRLMQPLNL